MSPLKRQLNRRQNHGTKCEDAAPMIYVSQRRELLKFLAMIYFESGASFQAHSCRIMKGFNWLSVVSKLNSCGGRNLKLVSLCHRNSNGLWKTVKKVLEIYWP